MYSLRQGRRRLARFLVVPGLLFTFSIAAHARTSRATCPLLIGGGGILVHDYQVVYSAKADETGSTINGLIIVRASPQARRLQPPPYLLERFRSGRLRHNGGGGSAGAITFVVDAAARTVWVNDSIPVQFLSENNVLLIEADQRGAYTVAGRAQINQHFPAASKGCDRDGSPDYREARDTLWSRFQASPTIRTFLGP